MAVSEKLKKKLLKRKEQIKNTGGGMKGVIFFQEGKKRIRLLNCGEEDFAVEAEHYYLGQEIKGVISPATFGLPCGIHEVYHMFRKGDESEQELAATFKPGKKFYSPAIAYKDDKGKEVDDRGAQLANLTNGMYNELIDWMIDDDYGDFTDPKTGYDIKVKREGKTKTDTEYSLMKMNSSKLDKKYNKIYNPEEMLKAILPTYEQTQEYIAQFLGMEVSDLFSKKKKKKKGSDDEPKKKKKKKKK